LAAAATIGPADLIAPNLGDQLVLSGDVSGSGSIYKLGPGSVILTGSNSYSGGTFVEAGALVAANSQSIADGSDLAVGIRAVQAFASAATPAAQVPTSVPEPATCMLAAVAMAIGAVVGRRRVLHR
jgi:autotransporter-associated beta strand protein